MPSAVFPRLTGMTPMSVTAPTAPGALLTITASGLVNTRATTQVGAVWSEEYPPIFIGKALPEEFLAWVRWAWTSGTSFTIKHLTTPGSGKAPNGTGSAGVQVQGAQTGNSILTDGWPLSTSNVVMPGDVIKFANHNKIYTITDAANSNGSGEATLNITPSIWTGDGLTDNEGVTTTDVEYRVKIIEPPNWPPVERGFWYTGFSLTFREA